MTHPWARAGSHRFPGDPSHAFALLQDPGRAGKISPWRSCRCCPRSTQTEGLSGHIISRLTQGFSIRCLRFTSDVTATHARLASGRRAAPLPGGRRTLWITSKGFRLHPFSFPGLLLSQGSSMPSDRSGGPQQVLDYLGRYTHRVAIANSRLIALVGAEVRFRWKDYRHPQRPKVMVLLAGEFIRRFLLHVLPHGFRRIRYFGFLANAHRSAKLALIRGLLALPEPEPAPKPADYHERYARLFGRSLDICPVCGGHLVEIAVLERAPRARPFFCDSS